MAQADILTLLSILGQSIVGLPFFFFFWWSNALYMDVRVGL